MLFPECTGEREIEEFTREGRKSTTSNLLARIRRLMAAMGRDDAHALYHNPERTIEWIERGRDAPPSAASKLALYSALTTLSDPKRFPGFDAPEGSRKQFLARSSVLGRIVREEQSSNLMDARESAVLLPWSQITRLYREKKHGLSDSQRLVAALYLAGGEAPAGAPRRLDYNRVRVFEGSPPGRPPEGTNYVVVRSPSRTDLVLQEYKTRRHYGVYEARLPPSVSREIHESLAKMPRKWLVQDKTGSPLSPAAFGRRVSSTMRELTGRSIGASNLRKSYITWLYSRRLTREQMAEYAVAMNHSPAEQKTYCRLRLGGGKRM